MFAPVDVLVVVPSDQSNASAAVSSQTATASTTSSNHNDAVWIRVSLLDRGVEPDDPSVLPQVSEPKGRRYGGGGGGGGGSNFNEAFRASAVQMFKMHSSRF